MSAAIPFRFKAGAPTPQIQGHHHRASSKSQHKPFKSRHASKSTLREQAKGRVGNLDASGGYRTTGTRKTPQQQVLSKWQKRNQAKQIRLNKHQARSKSNSCFTGSNPAPRIVAVIPLAANLDPIRAIQRLNDAVDVQATWPVIQSRQMRVRVDRFKQELLYLLPECNQQDSAGCSRPSLVDVLDASRVADYILFLLSPHERPDEHGEAIMRAIEGQGVGTVMAMVQGLDGKMHVKKRNQILQSLKDSVCHFFPTTEKILSVNVPTECTNLVRSMCTSTPKGIKWRDARTWMLIEDLEWSVDEQSGYRRPAIVTGVVRGAELQVNRLAQLGDWGHFQIEKIVHAPHSTIVKKQKRATVDAVMDETEGGPDILATADETQETLDELAPYEVEMLDNVPDDPTSDHADPPPRKGVLLDDHHYYSDDESHLPEAPKKLPKGTSNYQSAWFLGDLSDSGSDYADSLENQEDALMNLDVGTAASSILPQPQDGTEGLDHTRAVTETAPSEYPQSEIFHDRAPADETDEIAQYRASRKDEAKQDLEFPDEVELHPNVLARERLARYRGLKSLRTSPWETSEDRGHEPEDWNRLLPVPDYKRARKQAFDDAILGDVQPGTRVNIHLRAVPTSNMLLPSAPVAQQNRDLKAQKQPLALHSLLLHEQKKSVIHFSFTLASDHPGPLKSKSQMLLQCGPRRTHIRPIFSQLGDTPNDVHKYCRYVHPGQTVVASFIGHVTWGAVPVLCFARQANEPPDPSSMEGLALKSSSDANNLSSDLHLIGTGTMLPPSTSRIVAKRLILTGHPYKIHRKVVTVRYMFFNAEDVHWFKALQLWTKRGRSGYIKDSLGTHGYFKANFDGKINPQDAVGVSLYKRIFPRPAIEEALTTTQLVDGGGEIDDTMAPRSEPEIMRLDT